MALFVRKHDQEVNLFFLYDLQDFIGGPPSRTNWVMDIPFFFSSSTSSDNCSFVSTRSL